MKVATNQERLNELFDADPRNDTAIAEALGVSKQTVSMWRHGTRSPKKSVLIKISELYDVSIEWLMGFDVEKAGTTTILRRAFDEYYENNKPPDEEMPQTPEARILAKGIDRMPEEQRRALMTMMTGLYPGLFEKGNNEDDT